MHLPYTQSFGDAFAVAQTSVAVVLTAVVWRSPLRPTLACAPFLAALWLASIATFEAQYLPAVGFAVDPDHTAFVFTLSRFLGVLAFAVARPRWLVIPIAIGSVVLWKLCSYLQESDSEIAVAHVAFLAASFALHSRFASPSPPRSAAAASTAPRPYAAHDIALFATATFLGGVVAFYVLEKFCDTGDEWAYTYQADLLAHFKAYGEVPPCPSLFQNYWVFFYLGRAFAQYTPGWPLMMAPFQRLGIVWLASPVVFGLLCVAVARLARRVTAADARADERQVRWAGTVAGVCAMLPVGMLLNAGSRFPHVPVAALFAWSIECACHTTDRGMSKRAEWLWGAGLGVATSLLLATRHGDGATLGIGVFVVFAYWLVRRRVAWRSLIGAALGFGALAALSLVILRLQLGEWFKTGYSIADQYFAFAKVSFSMPKPTEFKYGIPLGTGAYMWWPCAPALGAAGLLLARGRGVAITVMVTIGSLASTAMYTALDFGRGYDAGYGPRYHLPTIVAMAVGGGVLLAPLLRDAARRTGPSLRYAGPAVLAVFAIVMGTLRIAPFVYPEAHAEIHLRDGTLRAIAGAHLKHAVVTVMSGEIANDPLDLTQNLPSVKDPEVLILLKRYGPEWECGRKHFADRTWYRAVGNTPDVKLEPE